MRIHVGCDLHFEFPETTPMIATLNVHFSRAPEFGTSGLSYDKPFGSHQGHQIFLPKLAFTRLLSEATFSEAIFDTSNSKFARP